MCVKAYDLAELAVRNLRESILRNSLTTIGISVGVASLVAMLSLGIGLQQLATRRLVRSGLFDTVVVTSRRDLRNFNRDEDQGGPAPAESPALDEPSRQKIEKLSNVTEAYPDLRFITSFTYETKPHLTMVAGVPESYRTNDAFEGMQGKVLEAVAAFTQANERVVGQLVELSSNAAREGLRAMGELQTAAMDAARAIPMPSAPTETLEDLRRDPFAWYRKGFQAVAESTQRAAKLIETNAQIVARNAERLQASTAASAKEIEQAASGYASRMKDIYTRA